MTAADTISELLGCAPTFAVDGVTAHKLHTPSVYLWQRDGEPLYIGKSENGAARPLDRYHHRLRNIQPADSLFIWTCADEADCIRTEQRLISELRPKLNGARPLRAETLDEDQLRKVVTERRARGQSHVRRLLYMLETECASLRAEVASLKSARTELEIVKRQRLPWKWRRHSAKQSEGIDPIPA